MDLLQFPGECFPDLRRQYGRRVLWTAWYSTRKGSDLGSSSWVQTVSRSDDRGSRIDRSGFCMLAASASGASSAAIASYIGKPTRLLAQGPAQPAGPVQLACAWAWAWRLLAHGLS